MKTIVTVSADTNRVREKFFRDIFGESSGFVCIAVLEGKSKSYREEFFAYPEQLGIGLEYINRSYHGRNVYFCPQLLMEPKRVKATVKTCPVIWADLDECDPGLLRPEPSIVLKSSPGRYQGFWILDKPAEPIEAEDAAHRIAYNYESLGVDKSGWDLTQLLRVPLTYNAKYSTEGAAVVPVVEIDEGLSSRNIYSIDAFKELSQAPGFEWVDEPLPQGLEVLSANAVLTKYKDRLDPQAYILFQNEPRGDTKEGWSGALWNLECLLLEAGVGKEEAFVVARDAACNKFRRDHQGDLPLWRDVCRAAQRVQSRITEASPDKGFPELLTADERKFVAGFEPTFIERYVGWAKSRGDAAWQYHEAGAFIILSQLLSGIVKLPTSFGVIVPNLWFMILADTTLTRKSTAMDMAVEMILQVDPDAVLATDGSLEGLMTGLAARPNRPGIFWRDEFSGLLEMIKKKDYYAGMIESLTKMYDGKYQKRVLRKEIIEIRDPILIIFCGGIRTRVLSFMDIEYVLSGFIPRFVFVEAHSDVANYQPIGPMTAQQDEVREQLVRELSVLRTSFDSEIIIKVGEQTVATKRTWDARLTEEAWDRYNKFERDMVNFGIESQNPETFTPVLDRLSKSGLKAAVLIAAISRKSPEQEVVVETKHLLRAIHYVDKWRTYNLDVAANVGKTSSEKQLDQIWSTIKREPGVARSKLMQNYHLTAREADWIMETLDQRGLVRRVKDGRSERFYPTLAR